MAIITTPGAGVSPYQTSAPAEPTVLLASADGNTVLSVAAAAAASTANATTANTAIAADQSVYVAGQAALNSLITSGQSGVFQGANVNITLEEQNFNTTNQVTSTTNYAEGANGSIQYNNGANGFAGDPYFTYNSGNVITPGIRTDGYFYSNGAPFISGGNAAIGNFVFNGDVMTISHANSTLSVTGNTLGAVEISTADGQATWTFDANGVLTVYGPINAVDGNDLQLTATSGGEIDINSSAGVYISAVDGLVVNLTTNPTINFLYLGSAPSGYLAGSYTNQPTSGGSGTGLTVDYTCATTNQPLTSVVINTFGSGYSDNDTISIDGGNAYFTIQTLSRYNFAGDNLTLPFGGGISFNYGYIDQDVSIEGDALRISGGNSVVIHSDEDGKTWKFAADGSTIFPTLTTPDGGQPTGNWNAPTIRIGDGINDGVISTPDGTLTNSYTNLILQPGQGYDDSRGGKTLIFGGRGGPTAGSGGGDVRLHGGYATGGGSGGDIELYLGNSTDANNTGTVRIVSTSGDSLYQFNNDGSLTPLYKPTNQRTGYGLSLVIGNENTQAVITGPAPVANVYNSAPRLVVAGQDGVVDGEGGDIYLWAGRSGPNGGSGGDIKVDGGQGLNGSEGGTIKIRGGSSSNTGNGAGYGGFVEIDAGSGDYGANVTITGGYGNSAANSGAIRIVTPYGGTWTFNNSGNLTLPSNTASINYANGQPYGGTGGANTGNVTFSDQIVIGTGVSNLVSGLYLAPSSSSANAVQYLRVRGDVSYEPTHIHFDTGNNQYFNQFIGDDNKYVLLSNTGNIVINTDDYAGNSAQWIFGTNGNLTLPGDMVINGNINIFGTDTALIQPTDNIPLAFITSGANAGTTSIWVSNISDPGNSSIAGMYAPLSGTGNVRIVTGNNAGTVNFWDFTSDGNLITPGASGDISGANVISANTFTVSSGNLSIVNQVANSAYSGIQSADNIPIGLISSNTDGTMNIGWRKNIANVSQGYAGIAINPAESPGNIVISGVEVAGSGNAASWIFDPFPNGTGNMVFPTGMHITSDGGGGTRISQNANFLKITAGGAGSFAAGWSQNEVAGTGPIALINAYGIGSTDIGNLYITTGNEAATIHSWKFDKTGNLTLPSNLIVPSNSIITGDGASPAPSINGFESIHAISFSASGNILSSGIVKTGVYVTGNIPAASIAGVGARAFVTDAAAVTFGNLYVGGAGNSMPVWSNGTNWYIG